MPQLIFQPANLKVEATERTKILAAAVRNKIPIRYGCGACKCGTCAVRISVDADSEVTDKQPNEQDLLEKMNLNQNSDIRLACQCRILRGSVIVDLDFQNEIP